MKLTSTSINHAERVSAQSRAGTVAAFGGLWFLVACPSEPGIPLPYPPPSEPRVELTRQECEDLAGSVVGDPGDGSVHRPDFRCADGEPPLGTIRPLPGEPVAIEGEVCCGGGAPSPALTRQECENLPGVVVGDPGDGSVHAPDYLCESGSPPVGEVMPLPGEPIAIEGEVCCAIETTSND